MDSTPVYKTISVKDVISRAKIQLRLVTSEFDEYLRIMLFEALNSLNAISQGEKKQCKLTFTDNTAELPKDLIKFIALRIGNASSNDPANDPIARQIFSQCQFAVYVDTPFLTTCGCDFGLFGNNTLSYTNGFQINNGFIRFNFDASIVEIQDATIAYMGLNVDDDGNSTIYERYERAVANYMCFMFTLSYSEKYNQYIIENYKQQWTYQAARIKGQDVARDFQNDKYEIGRMVRALIVSPRVQITNP